MSIPDGEGSLERATTRRWAAEVLPPDRLAVTRHGWLSRAAHAERAAGTRCCHPVEILGLPVAASACSARPHDVTAARELLRERVGSLPRLRAIVGDRAYRGLERLAARKGLALDIKAPPPGTSCFVPLRPLVRIERAFAQLGRWRRLSRGYEGSAASARAWLEVASVGYLTRRAVA